MPYILVKMHLQSNATTVPAPLQPPTPPTAPAAPGTATSGPVYSTGQLAMPMTRQMYDALQARRSELSRQLSSAQSRRDAVSRSLRNADNAASRAGLEQRLQVLDGRLAQLETDMAATGQLLASAPPAFSAGESGDPGISRRYGPFSSGQLTAISIVMTLAVFMPMALAFARSIVRRASAPKPAPVVLESAARLERMEQAIDSIAIEVERISEGQRFVTQLMAKRDPVLIEQGNG